MNISLITKKASRVKLILTDVDGVLTDGGIYYTNDHNEIKKFHVRDGQLCGLLIEEGITLGAITGRKSDLVQRRLTELNFKYIYQGIDDKIDKLQSILKDEKIGFEEIGYIGDDINDLKIFSLVGLSAAPSDTLDYIKKEVDYVTYKKGGSGAFREFAELILNAKGVKIG